MPEIWLRYGKVEIAIEIRRERLAQVIEDPLPDQIVDVINKELQELKEMDEIHVLAGDYELSTVKFIRHLIQFVSPSKVNIYSNEQILRQYKREVKETQCTFTKIDEEKHSIGIVDGVVLKSPTIFSRKDLYFISSVGLDPLFGFSGGPTALIKFLGDNLKFEALKRETELKPNPANDTAASWFAGRVAEELKEVKAIEVLPGRDDFSKVFTGNVLEAHKSATQELLKYSAKKVGLKIPLAVVTPGEESKCSTFDQSLNSLWNILPALEEGASVIVLTESSGGLGSEAITQYIYRGFEVKESIKRNQYIEGIENLYYLLNYGAQFDLGFLTTLPKSFIEKRLGYKSYTTGNDAVNYLIEKDQEKRKKITVLARGDKTLLIHS
ncbi:MAG: hypothetical protein QXJ17_01290 [Nitrososphaeria archaeon]